MYQTIKFKQSADGIL